MAEFKKRFFEAAKQTTSGCPLFEDREKGDLEDLEGEAVTLQRAYPLTGENGKYYAVWFHEETENFYLSNSALTRILDEGQQIADEEGVKLDEVIGDLVIKIGKPEKTKNGRRFRPVEVISG